MLLTVEDVHELMGLPSNGLPVKLTESVDEITNLCDELAMKNKFVPFTSLKSYLLETKDAGTEFKRKFVLYIIGALLCPTTRQAYTNHSLKWLKMLSPSVNSIGQSTPLIFLSTALLLPRSKSGLLCAAVCFF